MATHSSILAEESHGQRSLVGYNPKGHKESDTTDQLGKKTHTCVCVCVYVCGGVWVSVLCLHISLSSHHCERFRGSVMSDSLRPHGL